jgi:hypothetical protein
MEVMCQLHATAALHAEKEPSSVHSMGGWVGHIIDLDGFWRSVAPAGHLALDHPATSLVTVVYTEILCSEMWETLYQL